jgi:hypothetical protein
MHHRWKDRWHLLLYTFDIGTKQKARLPGFAPAAGRRFRRNLSDAFDHTPARIVAGRQQAAKLVAQVKLTIPDSTQCPGSRSRILQKRRRQKKSSRELEIPALGSSLN